MTCQLVERDERLDHNPVWDKSEACHERSDADASGKGGCGAEHRVHRKGWARLVRTWPEMIEGEQAIDASLFRLAD
jgi:hypothetical protein